jgi:hypothetical protein
MQSRNSTVINPRLSAFVAMALIAVVLFGPIDPASAKGPESVTITGPESTNRSS